MTADSGGRRARVVATLAVAVTIAAVVVNASVGLGSVPGGDGAAEAASVDADLRSSLGVFDRPRLPSDEFPGHASNHLADSPERQPGENLDQARRVDVGGEVVYLWPMADGVCDTLGGCTPLDRLKREGVDVGTSFTLDKASGTLESVRVYGVAVDGVDDVLVHTDSDSATETKVIDNVFLAKLNSARPTRIEWRDSGGTHIRPLRVPAPQTLLRSLENATTPDSE
jgi:hypothetical protein